METYVAADGDVFVIMSLFLQNMTVTIQSSVTKYDVTLQQQVGWDVVETNGTLLKRLYNVSAMVQQWCTAVSQHCHQHLRLCGNQAL